MLIGITGTIGAGKNTVADHIVKKYGFVPRSGSDLLAEEVINQGLPATRENMRTVANNIRLNYGSGYLIDSLLKDVDPDKDNVVVGFFRTVNEISHFRRLGKKLMIIGVNAQADIRYKRVIERQSSKDNITWEEFITAEKAEADSEDPDKQNMEVCLKMADAIIHNDSTLGNLYSQIDAIIEGKNKNN